MTLFEAVFLIVFWTWVASAILFLRNTILPRLPLAATPQMRHLPYETVRFQATDGVPLAGWKILTEPTAPWIILCHGVGSNRADLLDIAAGLHEAGFNVFLFDFRGHGDSRGRVTSFGWRECCDLEGALAFLGQQADIPARPLGVYGISMGAAVALLVAADDERLGAVAADSPYTNLDASISRHLRLLYPWLPLIPFRWFVLLTYRLRFGVWPRRVSPATAITRELRSRPVLFIYGAADIRTPLNEIRPLISPKDGQDLWVVEGAGHLEAFSSDPEAYVSCLVGFFQSSLLG